MPHLAAPLALVLLLAADSPNQPGDVISALETAVADAIAKAEPSVVAITRVKGPNVDETTAVRGKNPDPGFPNTRFPNEFAEFNAPDFLPLPGDYGSGVVIGNDGAILTAYHVIKGAARIRVRAPGVRQEFDAEVIAADPRSDLAVIVPRMLPAALRPKLVPVALGDATKLRKGAFLISLGNPYNTARDGRASASWGILSNTTRRVEPPQETSFERQRMFQQMFRYQPTLLQLDAKLNLGMSGGAVINLKGELVGITTTGGNAEGFDAQAGYAIPLDGLGQKVVEALRVGKEVEYGFLGITLDQITPNKVRAVQPNTPAAQGDLVTEDVIVEVNGNPITEEESLSLALSRVPVGEPVKLTVLRGGRRLEKNVFVSKYPVSGQVIATNRPNPWRGIRVDYTSVLPGTPTSDAILDAMAKGCVGITEVETGSSAETAGLRQGQVITEVDGKPVRSPREFAQAVTGKKGPVTLTVGLEEVTVKP
jgi:S1-C subfamily serine protease